MQAFSELVRRASTFLLAVFLWLHALFLWNIDSTLVSRRIQFLHLTATEALLFALLVIFTCASGSGFWRPFRSLAYIYFFPFVILAFGFYWLFLVLRMLHRWFKAQASVESPSANLIDQESSQLVPSAQTKPGNGNKIGIKQRMSELLLFLLRPFRRFMFLWCVLLLVTTHKVVLWLCLMVVLVQLARKVFFILQLTLFSGPFLTKLGARLLGILDKPLAALAAVTSDAAPTKDLKNLWEQLNIWRKVLDFLKDPYLLSRWAWVAGIIFIGSVYLYFSVLFSFVYYGIARINDVAYSWADALVSSVFIPFAYSDLPRIIWIRLLGYTHASLILAIGIGTVVNFLRRRLDGVRKAAAQLSDRLTDPVLRDKLQILEVKVASSTAVGPPDASK